MCQVLTYTYGIIRTVVRTFKMKLGGDSRGKYTEMIVLAENWHENETRNVACMKKKKKSLLFIRILRVRVIVHVEDIRAKNAVNYEVATV